ncbi:MAG: hypothetical protein WA830_07350 [Candidatus Sulfotelmatobacter sp.]
MRLKLFARLVLLFAIPAIAQDTPKTIALTDKSTIPPEDISKVLQKECPNVSIISNVTKSDYTLDAVRKTDPKAGQDSFDFNLIDRDGKTFRSASNPSIANAVKDVCHTIFIATGGQRTALPAPSKKGKTAVLVEVVDTQNLTQSVDARGDFSGGLVGGIVASTTGRRTHTDTSTIHVIVNGEHALLDCYERRKGCTTLGPGKYYGELDGESVWVNYEMPLTHKTVRNHYRVAGGW